MNIGISADSLAAKVKALQAKNENDTTNNSTEISKTDRKSRDEIQQKKHQAAVQTKDVLNQMNSLLNNTALFSYPMQTVDTKGAAFTNSDLASLASTLKDSKPNGQGQQLPSLVNAFVAVLLEILESMMSSTENVLDLQEKGFQGNLQALKAATKMSQTTIDMASSTRDQALSAAASTMASSLISLANGVFGLGQLYKSASTPRNMQTELDHLAKQTEMDPKIKEQFDQFQKDIPQQQTTDRLFAQLDESLPSIGSDKRTFKETLERQSEADKKKLDESRERISEHIKEHEAKVVDVREKPNEIAKQVGVLIKEQKDKFGSTFDDIRSCGISDDQKAQALRDAIAAKPGDLKLDVPASYAKSDILVQAGILKKNDGAASFEVQSTIGFVMVDGAKDASGKTPQYVEYHQLRILDSGMQGNERLYTIEHVIWSPKKDASEQFVMQAGSQTPEYELRVSEVMSVKADEKVKFEKQEQLSILKKQDVAAGILTSQKAWLKSPEAQVDTRRFGLVGVEEGKIQAAKAAKVGADKELERATKAEAEARDEKNLAQQAVTDAQSKAPPDPNEVEEATKKLQIAEGNHKEAQATLNAAQAKKTEADEKLKEVGGEIAVVEVEIDARETLPKPLNRDDRLKLSDLGAQKISLSRRIGEKQADYVRKSEELDKKGDALKAVESQKVAADRELEAAKTDMEQFGQEKIANNLSGGFRFTDRATTAQARHLAASDQCQTVQAEYETAQQEFATAQASKTTAEGELKELGGQKAVVEAELKAATEKYLSGDTSAATTDEIKKLGGEMALADAEIKRAEQKVAAEQLAAAAPVAGAPAPAALPDTPAQVALKEAQAKKAELQTSLADLKRKQTIGATFAHTAQDTFTTYTKLKSYMTHYAEVGSMYAKKSQFMPGTETPFQRIYEIAAKATSEAEVSYQQTQIFTQSVANPMVQTLSSISTMESQQASAQSQELSAQASAVQQQNDASVKIMQQVASDFLSTANTCLEKLLEMIVSTLSVAARALDTRG